MEKYLRPHLGCPAIVVAENYPHHKHRAALRFAVIGIAKKKIFGGCLIKNSETFWGGYMATIEKLLHEEVSTAEAILRVLEERGIDMGFGIAGGNTGRFFHALYFHPSTIRTVLVRHETRAR